MSHDPKTRENTVIKPLILQVRDAKTAIVATVNEVIQSYNMPACLVRPMLEEVIVAIKELEKQQQQLAETQYAKALEAEATKKDEA